MKYLLLIFVVVAVALAHDYLGPRLTEKQARELFKLHAQEMLASFKKQYPNHTENQLMEELAIAEVKYMRYWARGEKTRVAYEKMQVETITKEWQDIRQFLPPFTGEFEKTPLTQQLRKRYPTGTVGCSEGCFHPGHCDTGCSFDSDSVTIHYRNRGLTEAYIQVRDVAMLDGKVKIGMTWNDFVKATGTTTKYREPITLEWRVGYDDVTMSFRFEKGILRYATFYIAQN